MKVVIKPSRLCGEIAAPPSKSYAHRLLICAALSDGVSTVRGISKSEDMLATLDCMSALGIEYKTDGDNVTVCGGLDRKQRDTEFACRESGSTLRFFMPIALAAQKKSVFTGSERLISRGIGIYEKLFSENGIEVSKTDKTITLDGTLKAGKYSVMGNISSQFITGLLFALPLLSGDSELRVIPPVESRPYIDITIDAMKTFGVEIEEPSPNTFKIHGNSKYRPTDTSVEGDWSNAAALFALGMSGDVKVTGLKDDSVQGDKVCVEHLNRLSSGTPTIDISDCPDLGPVLFAAAAIKNGATFTGTARLRIKESDRASAMAEEMRKFGIETEVSDNSVTVKKGELCAPTEVLSSHNDHRIVMAMTLLSSYVGGVIDTAEAINKSYPDFFKETAKLGLEAEYRD